MNIEILPEYPTSSANDQSKKGYVSGPQKPEFTHKEKRDLFTESLSMRT